MFTRINNAVSDARRVMMAIRSSGDWTPLEFYHQQGAIHIRRWSQDVAGVRVAFLSSNI